MDQASRLAILKAEIQADPFGLGYASKLPDSPGHVEEMVNRVGSCVIPKARFVTARVILERCPQGDVFLDKLTEASKYVSACKWALDFLRTTEGLDVNSTAVSAMMTKLIDNNLMTAELAQPVLDIAKQSASRAEALGIGRVTINDVIDCGVM